MDEEIETLFKAEPPFTVVEEGHGYVGVVLRNKKTDELQCHICGKWFKHLSYHINKGHKILTEEYKRTYGLPLNYALCSKGLSVKFRENAQESKNWIKGCYKKGHKRTNNQSDRWKKRHRYSVTCAAFKNAHATCDKQILDRFMVVSDIVGRNPSSEDIDKYDGGLRDVIINRYGSLNSFRKKNNVGIIRKTPRKWTREKLIGILRKYFEEHNNIPSSNYFIKKRDGMPQRTSFFRHFGSWSKALACAGLVQ